MSVCAAAQILDVNFLTHMCCGLHEWYVHPEALLLGLLYTAHSSPCCCGAIGPLGPFHSTVVCVALYGIHTLLLLLHASLDGCLIWSQSYVLAYEINLTADWSIEETFHHSVSTKDDNNSLHSGYGKLFKLFLVTHSLSLSLINVISHHPENQIWDSSPPLLGIFEWKMLTSSL
jgi:hypothetical protein